MPISSAVRSNAHVVLSFLQGQSSLESIGGHAMVDLQKAVKLSPGDWRLHSMLATRNMVIYNTALALESIQRALELSPDDFSKFLLGIRT